MKRYATVFAKILLVFTAAFLLMGASGGSHGGEEAAFFDFEAFPWKTFIAGIFNFAVFMWILIKFGGPYIKEYYAERKENFVEEMEAAKEARKQAEAKLEEYNEKLAALEQERQALLDEYHAQGEREKQRIVEEAKQQVEKMREDAEATIDQEVKKAKAMLEQRAVDLAVEMAEDKAREQLDDNAQQQLLERYVAQLEDSEAA